jgi:glycosyltransferase involved in cell wall biosynthesis
MESMQPVIYADLRCLQDENYRVRGIGVHVSSLFRTRQRSRFSNVKAIGLVDPQLPKLLPEYRTLFDEISYATNICWNEERGIFIDGSPMGHDARFSARFMRHPAFLKAAVVYDFIPLDWPGYLPTVTSRIDYIGKLARLRSFHLFFPLSKYVGRRTRELLGIQENQMVITGAAVRRNLYELRDRIPDISVRQETADPYFFITYGGDPRKNVDIVIKAVRRLNVVHGRRIVLKVAGHYDMKISGHYDEACKARLLRLAGHAEGKGFLEFCPLVSDEELVSLYSGAIATIVPSHIEGFSLPVVEAVVCGSPVVVSTCEAHLELVQQPEALFPSDNADDLCARLDNLLKNPSLRDLLRTSQAHLAKKFHEDVVGKRFWDGIEALSETQRAPAVVINSAKPQVAFLSSFPPDRTVTAFYTANMVRATEKFFRAAIYTNARRPLPLKYGIRDAGRISFASLLNWRYNQVISVIGESESDFEIFHVFARCGGPCILHDSPPFLESVVRRASPLMIHSVVQHAEIKERFGVDAHVLPSCPTQLFSEEELQADSRNAARERLRISPGVFCITSFGTVAREKGMHTCIAAVDLLRSWNIPADLYFVGDAGEQMHEIYQVASLYGIDRYVHAMSGYVDDTIYRDFLIASDAAVQVRRDRSGEICSPLLDCISAGLASVTTEDVAASCEAPEYILTVPDRYSPLQIAEQLAQIWESRNPRDILAEARVAYLKSHNFELYGQRLVEILGFA